MRIISLICGAAARSSMRTTALPPRSSMETALTIALPEVMRRAADEASTVTTTVPGPWALFWRSMR